MVADEVKTVLVQWLLTKLTEHEAIASELQFFAGANRADLVISSTDRLCAIEIKGPKDDFRRLARQEQAYRQFFLESYVAVTPNHLENARSALEKGTGILCIEKGMAKEVRPASRARTLAKEASTHWLLTSELSIAVLGNSDRSSSKDELTALAVKKFTKTQLTKLALESVYARVSPKYHRFLEERGKNINSDDIRTLSVPRRIA